MDGGLRSLFSKEEEEKNVPAPRLQGIEVRYRKTDYLPPAAVWKLRQSLAKLHFLFLPC